jgi:hypothetical protein
MIYSGRKILNYNTIITLFYFLPMAIIVSLSKNMGNSLFVLIPLICFLFIQEAFYFEISDEFLIVRNIGLPFLKVRYELDRIDSIKISNSGFQTFSLAQLKVNIENKRTIGFRSASLKKKDWQLLIQDLKNRQIKINLMCSILG